jgi:ankyrin repeat protein
LSANEILKRSNYGNLYQLSGLLAIREDHESIMHLLLDSGAYTIDSKDEDGRTPLSWAAVYGCSKTVRMLLQQDDVDVNCKDNQGRTPLSWAASDGICFAVLKQFLEREDVDVNSKDNEGRTPLSWAAGLGNQEVVGLLIGWMILMLMRRIMLVEHRLLM